MNNPDGPIRPKSPWDVSKSVFKDFALDSDKLMNKCFDQDWGCSALGRIIKDHDEEERVRKYLRPKYRVL